MKTLLFLRHAKAKRADPSVHGYASEMDHARDLTARGERDARHVGRALRRLDLVPELVVSSTAVRARRTHELAAEAGGWQAPVEARADLYLPDPGVVLAVLQEMPFAVSRVLIVGHEPAWSEVLGRLVGGARVRVPTAALGCVEVDASRWADVREGAGVLRWLLPPAVLRALV